MLWQALPFPSRNMVGRLSLKTLQLLKLLLPVPTWLKLGRDWASDRMVQLKVTPLGKVHP